MSALGHKRAFCDFWTMSALPPMQHSAVQKDAFNEAPPIEVAGTGECRQFVASPIPHRRAHLYRPASAILWQRRAAEFLIRNILRLMLVSIATRIRHSRMICMVPPLKTSIWDHAYPRSDWAPFVCAKQVTSQSRASTIAGCGRYSVTSNVRYWRPVSTGRRNTPSHSFCWGLNPKVLRPLPAMPKSPVSLPP